MIQEIMVKIIPLNTRRQKNDEHFQCGSEFETLVVQTGADVLQIEPEFELWTAAFSVENYALKRINASALTPVIEQKDVARGKTWRSLNFIFQGMLLHFDPVIATAAAKLKVVFTTYGNIAKKSLTEKTGAYSNFLEEMGTEQYAAAIETIGIADWMGDLQEKNTEVSQLMQQRDTENTEKPDVPVMTARKEVDRIYAAIVERINAMVVFGKFESAEQKEAVMLFIRHLNVIIERYNLAIVTRKGRKDSWKDKPEL